MSDSNEQNGYQPGTSWVEAALLSWHDRGIDAPPDEYDQQFAAALQQQRAEQAGQVSEADAALGAVGASYREHVEGGAGSIHELVHSSIEGAPKVERPVEPEAEFDAAAFAAAYGIDPATMDGVENLEQAHEWLAMQKGEDVVAAENETAHTVKIANAMKAVTDKARSIADSWGGRYGNEAKGLNAAELKERIAVSAHVGGQLKAIQRAGAPMPTLTVLMNRARLSLHNELPGSFKKAPKFQSIHHAVIGKQVSAG